MLWTHATEYLNGQATVGTFYEKESQKTSQEEL